MACIPCGSGGVQAPQMPGMHEWVSNGDGTYTLASFPDCYGGHHGQFEGLSIFIVAPGVPNIERLFRYEDLGLASEYMKSMTPQPAITKVPTSSLCDEAVLSVYG